MGRQLQGDLERRDGPMTNALRLLQDNILFMGKQDPTH